MARPSILTVKTRILGDLRAALGLVAQTRRTFVEVISNAIAGQFHLLYAYVDNLFQESHPIDATGERLDQWGEVLELSRSPASFARINIEIKGLRDSRIEAGTELKKGENVYFVEASATMAETELTISVRAALIGEDKNLENGDELNFSTSVAGIENKAVVITTLVEGTDAETDAAYRDRINQFFRRSTWRAGGVDDYIAWALVNNNVRYAWVAKKLNGIANRIGVFVINENDELLEAGEIEEVQEYIDARAPVTADPVVQSPTKEEIDFTINIRENSTSTQESVERNLKDLFAEARAPKGTVNSDGSVNTGQVYISQVREAISQAVGEEDHELVSPTENIIPEETHGILVVGDITFGDFES